MPLAERIEMHGLESCRPSGKPKFSLKMYQTDPCFKATSCLCGPEAVKSVRSRGKTFINFLSCADVFMVIKSECKSSSFLNSSEMNLST